eukprot:TRINITY_DN5122_c3_g1_i1.p1 TRINITY_DN5122_c3_g1~~TRINITY_DN5122_c3_g1_i1.p1  ORF type:complete len:427 (-),score=201.94 TRINITY_DN5122_c3_g1_i1:114-1394(-)
MSNKLLPEGIAFAILFVLFEGWLITIYGVWIGYLEGEEAKHDVESYYNFFRDINVMIFFGFGFLMTFMRRYAFSALGYTFLITAFVCQWSVPLGLFFREVTIYEDDIGDAFDVRVGMGCKDLVEALFAGATVMITFGVIIGRVSPLQMLIIGILEPVFYWLNIYIILFQLEALDIGGGMTIHAFGAYFGMTLSRFFTTRKSAENMGQFSNYTNDIFSFAGTFFLFLMWPSFNGVLATHGAGQIHSFVNTFLSLTGAIVSTFVLSRLYCGFKFDVMHLQNAPLAGGVAMGVAADLNLQPGGAIGIGVIAGALSTTGYKFLMPFLRKKLLIQDVCGVHNLHGMPGILSGLVGVFATLRIGLNEENEFPHGESQAALQIAALGITIGLAIFGGLITGVICKLAEKLRPLEEDEYFEDKVFFEMPKGEQD